MHKVEEMELILTTQRARKSCLLILILNLVSHHTLTSRCYQHYRLLNLYHGQALPLLGLTKTLVLLAIMTRIVPLHNARNDVAMKHDVFILRSYIIPIAPLSIAKTLEVRYYSTNLGMWTIFRLQVS